MHSDFLKRLIVVTGDVAVNAWNGTGGKKDRNAARFINYFRNSVPLERTMKNIYIGLLHYYAINKKLI